MWDDSHDSLTTQHLDICALIVGSLSENHYFLSLPNWMNEKGHILTTPEPNCCSKVDPCWGDPAAADGTQAENRRPFIVGGDAAAKNAFVCDKCWSSGEEALSRFKINFLEWDSNIASELTREGLCCWKYFTSGGPMLECLRIGKLPAKFVGDPPSGLLGFTWMWGMSRALSEWRRLLKAACTRKKFESVAVAQNVQTK